MGILARTEEIPRKRWPRYFDEFSRRHDGWLVDVQELMGERGAQREATALPFRGATAVLDPRPAVTIELGRDAADHVEHRIEAPQRVWVESLAGGAEAALEIESARGRKTVIAFRSPQPPEAVDGMPAPARARPGKTR
ncbi:MAG TPA: DUF5335 family protein [Thermoanaerobaculia bacterium]|nr:DUF5335 family protein [Thermoanaerobaculia bacterium]